MPFMKLGLRNLFRQKRRTFITLLAITFGVGCLLLANGHSRFIEWGLRETTIHSETGHLQVFNEEALSNEEETILEYGLEDYEAIRELLRGQIEVSVVAARIGFSGLVSNGEKSVAFLGDAVEPTLERRMRSLFGSPGSVYDTLVTHEDEGPIIALGEGLAGSLGAAKGDYLTILSVTAGGALNAIDVKVVATFRGMSSEYDKRALIVPVTTAQTLLNSRKAEKLVVTLDDTGKTERLHADLTRLLRDKGFPVALRKWPELTRYYHSVKTFYHQIVSFMSLIVFIIVFFSTANTIMMSVVERTREIGTMLSMGTSRLQTLEMFFAEGLSIGILGVACSTVFAVALSFAINSLKIVLPPAPGMSSGYPLEIRNEVGFFARIALVTVAVAIGSSVLPALRVTRMRIVDALRHV